MTRIFRVLVSLVVVFALTAGTIELVRMANGDFAGDYKLSGMFPRAGEGLHPGSAVVFRGVQIGRVSTIALADNEAKIVLLIDPTFNVPASATATIQPVNLFGAEQVSIATPNSTRSGPYLAHGATFAHASSSPTAGEDQHQRPVHRVGRTGQGQRGGGTEHRGRSQVGDPVGRPAR
jgi:phospholipid/cholesterol/gamma-HCH transport system substrate-binding protein